MTNDLIQIETIDNSPDVNTKLTNYLITAIKQ